MQPSIYQICLCQLVIQNLLSEIGYDGSDEDYLTPSPSDSAVADLEIVLKVTKLLRTELWRINPKPKVTQLTLDRQTIDTTNPRQTNTRHDKP